MIAASDSEPKQLDSVSEGEESPDCTKRVVGNAHQEQS